MSTVERSRQILFRGSGHRARSRTGFPGQHPLPAADLFRLVRSLSQLAPPRPGAAQFNLGFLARSLRGCLSDTVLGVPLQRRARSAQIEDHNQER